MAEKPKPLGDEDKTPTDLEAQRAYWPLPPPEPTPPPQESPMPEPSPSRDTAPPRPLPAVVAAVHVPLPRASPTLKGAPYVGGDGSNEERSSVTRPRTGRTREMAIWGAIIVAFSQLIGVVGKCSAPLVNAMAARIAPPAPKSEGGK